MDLLKAARLVNLSKSGKPFHTVMTLQAQFIPQADEYCSFINYVLNHYQVVTHNNNYYYNYYIRLVAFFSRTT